MKNTNMTNTTKTNKEDKTMKNTSTISKKIIASMLAIMTTFSTLAVTASADNSEAYAIPDTEITAAADQEAPDDDEIAGMARKLVGAFADAGFDMLGDAFPGAKFVAEPLKAIFGSMIEGEDATEAALKQLAEENRQQYEDLKNRIDTLGKDINTYTKALENVTVNENNKQTLAALFRLLNANVKDLYSKIKGIMTNKEFTPEQKLVMLADLNNEKGYGGSYLVNVRHTADMISSTISSNGTKLSIDLYQSLFDLCTKNYLFAGEAHKEAMISANALTEEYMYANALLLQCQNAAKALDNNSFTAEQIADICKDPVVFAAYNRFRTGKDVSFDNDKFSETVKRIDGCVEGYKHFAARKLEGNRYINKGTQAETVFKLDGTRYTSVTEDVLKKQINNQYFDKTGMERFIDYIRETGNGKMSVAEFLRKNDQTLPEESYTGDAPHMDHRYILVDTKITVTKKYNRSEYVTYGAGHNSRDATIYIYDMTETVKAIDIYDPECKVQNIVFRTYEREEEDYYKPRAKKIKDYTVAFLTISAHAATEKDNIKIKGTVNVTGSDTKAPKLDIKGPKLVFSDYKPAIKGPIVK